MPPPVLNRQWQITLGEENISCQLGQWQLHDVWLAEDLYFP
jgi:hypothetical protein